VTTKVVATIEARMASSRLPGKILAPILGEPALARLVERLRRVKRLEDIVIATTVSGADDPVEALAERCGVRCFRGSEEDVLGRVVQAAASAGAGVIVEVTGDCPLLAPEVIDRALDLYETGRYDIVSNTWRLSYPQGADAQVFDYELLRQVAKATTDPTHREHVSLYFYEHPERYRIHTFEAPPELRGPELRFQLDYPEDLAFITAVYEALYPLKPDFTLADVFDLLRRRPALKLINAHCQEKQVR
jgi:spore coat polysaccharide biosynthesis protein SpsF